MSQSSQPPITSSSKISTSASTIQTAKLHWQLDDNGVTVPRSSDFGDVYFSKTDGLAESRHVFIDGNDLTNRFANLKNFERFVIGEIGFGTGLNILAIWQLWQQIRPDNHSHLHIITTEKFPLRKTDLEQALSVWTELAGLSQQLIDNYPPPLAGCRTRHVLLSPACARRDMCSPAASVTTPPATAWCRRECGRGRDRRA